MVSGKVVGAGAFVVIGVLLFTAALFMIGERRMLFDDRFELYTEFAKLGQLEVGAIVRVAGMDAGKVTEVIVPASPAGKFRVRMEVRDNLHPLVRTDSIASVQTEGLVGGIFLSIATGSEGAPLVPEKGTIPGREPFVLADVLEQASETFEQVAMTVDKISGDLETTIERMEVATKDAHQLFIDITPQIKSMAENGSRMSADTRLVIAGIHAGEGTLGKLIKDDTLYVRAREVADEAQVAMANVRQVSDEARRAIVDFRSEDGPAQGMFADVRVTLGQARDVVANMADVTEAMKHNFLLRGFFNRRGYFDLDAISPAEYSTGVLENGKRKAMRIWLGSPVLFATAANGTEELTDEGRARIDSAMTTFLKFLPTNPLVVEGYASDGSEGDRYQRSRQRTGIVREYVLGRFQLTPQNTGYIALAGDAVDSPGGDQWDGVALALFIDVEELQFVPQPRVAAVKAVAVTK